LLERRRHRAHQRILAPAFLEVLELQVDVAGGLLREVRVLWIRRVAVGAVAGRADVDLRRRLRIRGRLGQHVRSGDRRNDGAAQQQDFHRNIGAPAASAGIGLT